MSFRVKKDIYNQMKLHDEINWSAVIRKAVIEKMKHKENKINEEVAREVLDSIRKIRESKVFDKGKNSTELIREWRDKRR